MSRIRMTHPAKINGERREAGWEGEAPLGRALSLSFMGRAVFLDEEANRMEGAGHTSPAITADPQGPTAEGSGDDLAGQVDQIEATAGASASGGGDGGGGDD